MKSWKRRWALRTSVSRRSRLIRKGKGFQDQALVGKSSGSFLRSGISLSKGWVAPSSITLITIIWITRIKSYRSCLLASALQGACSRCLKVSGGRTGRQSPIYKLRDQSRRLSSPSRWSYSFFNSCSSRLIPDSNLIRSRIAYIINLKKGIQFIRFSSSTCAEQGREATIRLHL